MKKHRIEKFKIEIDNDLKDLDNGSYVPIRDRERFRRQLQRGEEIILLVTGKLLSKLKNQ